jgi:glyoxylase I family protein
MQAIAIDHVVLRVTDLDRAIRFYTEVVGLTVERRQDEIGLVQLRIGLSLIDLVSVDGRLGRMGGAAPGAEGRNMDHLCLRIADFDAEAVRRDLAAAGMEVGDEGLRYGSTGEAVSIYATDPDGNGLEFRA